MPKGLNLSLITKNTGLVVGFALVSFIMIMIIPIPPMLMDMFLAMSIASGLVIMLVSIFLKDALGFSIFPTMLLIVTIFRLSLNVASTRLILLNGHTGTSAAGKIIESFGNFVVGGNYVVGLAVFIILVVINFVVITKGAGRVAEVGARFVLDAMPGKQMAIDADLSAGLINDEEARNRRRKIETESEFYGAMDGASKFVRGDAIAGIIITIVNIIVGIIIGVLQKDMSITNAVSNYTMLTIGDGLVSQMPALIISTSAGVIVTKVASEVQFGEQVAKQLLFQPTAVASAGIILALLSFVPGLPTFPFLILAIAAGVVSYFTHKNEKKTSETESQALEAVKRDEEEKIEDLLPLDLLELEVGYGLISVVDKAQNGNLLERIQSIRRQFALDYGVIIPPVHIRDNLQLQPAEYSMRIKGNKVATGTLMGDHFLAMDPGDVENEIPGIPTKEPTFGLPAMWITEDQKEDAEYAGYTVVDLSTIITTHFQEIIRVNCHELIGRQEVQNLVDHLKSEKPKVVEAVLPDKFKLGGVVRILQNLLKEQISIRDLLTIMETIGDNLDYTKDVGILTEYVREALGRTITMNYVDNGSDIEVITFDGQIETLFESSLQNTEHGEILSLAPEYVTQILESTKAKVQEISEMDKEAIMLCSSSIRRHVRRFFERFLPNLVVIAHNEIVPDVSIKSLGEVRLENAS
jgi:flagellar biosynthesis protein FlhA